MGVRTILTYFSDELNVLNGNKLTKFEKYAESIEIISTLTR